HLLLAAPTSARTAGLPRAGRWPRWRAAPRTEVRAPPPSPRGSGSGQRPRVGRVEGLHAGLVVAVERGDLPGVADADVIVGRIGEPHADLVEVDAKALAVDHRARERLVDDEVERVVGVAVLVRADVADVLGGAERLPSRL